MTGISAAYALSQTMDPSQIMVVDSGNIGQSTTGHSAGLLVDSVEEDFADMDLEEYAEIIKGRRGVLNATRQERIKCDPRMIPSVYFAKDSDQSETVRREFEARKKAGFKVRLVNHTGLTKSYSIDAILGVINQEGYCINPVGFCRGLAEVLENRGVKLFEDTKIREYDPSKKIAKTQKGSIHYTKLILTNSSSALENELLKNKTLLLSTAAAVTKPLSLEQYRRIFGDGEFLGWSAHPTAYTYFRPVGHGRLLVGGLDRSSSINPQTRTYEELELGLMRELLNIFPSLSGIEFSHLWSGVIPLSVDNKPFVGEFEKEHYLGLYGPGLPNSFRAGQILAELVSGKQNKSFELFRHDREIKLKNRIRALTKYEPVTTIANKLYFS